MATFVRKNLLKKPPWNLLNGAWARLLNPLPVSHRVNWMLGRRGRPLLWQALVTEQKPITRLQRAASSASALKPPGEWRERSILPTHRIFWKRWEAPPQTPNLNADPLVRRCGPSSSGGGGHRRPSASGHSLGWRPPLPPTSPTPKQQVAPGN